MQRTKDGRTRTKSRHAPNARSRQRRLPLQQIRGRHPVLPPIGIGGGASWSNDPYQLTGQPPIMIPTMAYPVVPFHHQVLSPSTMPVNAFPPQPYATAMSTVPTSTLVYYAPPFPAAPYQWMWTEPNSTITELATDQENDDGSGSCSEEEESTQSIHFIQQGMLYPDTTLSQKVCEEMGSQIIESVIGELVLEVVTACTDDIIKSYLNDAHLLKTSSTERLDAVTHRTSRPTNTSRHGRQNSLASRQREIRHLQLQPLTQQPHKTMAVNTVGQLRQKSVGKRHKFRDCKEVAEHMCSIILDELLFQELLEVAVMGRAHKTAEAFAGGILNELLFDECLKLLFEYKDPSPTARHSKRPVLHQL